MYEALAIGVLAMATPYEIAKSDYLQIPEVDRPYVRYLQVPEGYPIGVVNVVIASHSKAPNLGASKPLALGPTVVRLDFRALQWDPHDWMAAIKDYPYDGNDNPLMIRADWLVDRMVDMTRSDAGYRLLFGGDSIPTTGEQFLERVGVDTKANRQLQLDLGVVEGRSGVAKQRERLLQLYETLGGYAARTRDFEKLTVENSPLDRLQFDDTKSDASEIIVGMRKRWRGGSGALQVYALTDAKDQIVNEAPVSIVEDSTRVGGLPSIRNPVSCISCHSSGLLPIKTNKVAEAIELGVELDAYNDPEREIERLYLSDPTRFLDRASEDYASAIEYLANEPVEEFVVTFRGAINGYRENLDISDAAVELGLDEDEFRGLLATVSIENAIAGNLARMAYGEAVSRDYFESGFLKIQALRLANPPRDR